MRVAVLGLYNSGSSCVAGILHRLGIDMGAPFWTTPAGDFHEPRDLTEALRALWREPYAIATAPETARIELLRRWVRGREAAGATRVGAKHPLLALAPRDLLAAWGEQTRFVWCCRDVEQCIRGLHDRHWFGPWAEPLQRRLARSLRRFFRDAPPHFVPVDYTRMRRERRASVLRLAQALELPADATRLAAATEWIRPA